MKLQHKFPASKVPSTDMLAIFAFEGARPTLPALPAGVVVPKHALQGFKGELREARLADATSGPAKRVLVIGLGKKEAFAIDTAEKLRRAAAIAVQRAESAQCETCTLLADDSLAKLADETLAKVAGADVLGHAF